jgi:hypothetical protein
VKQGDNGEKLQKVLKVSSKWSITACLRMSVTQKYQKIVELAKKKSP